MTNKCVIWGILPTENCIKKKLMMNKLNRIFSSCSSHIQHR